MSEKGKDIRATKSKKPDKFVFHLLYFFGVNDLINFLIFNISSKYLEKSFYSCRRSFL